MTSTKKIGPCGGFTGVPIDMNVEGITCIVKINIRHGAAIDALTVNFIRNGREESTGLLGGQGGNSSEFELQQTEYITSVKGHVGHMWGYFVVRSLTFETNLNTYGPYGEEDGIPFELPAINGQIIGFYGRVGELFDSLGVYVKVNSATDGTGGNGNADGSTGTDSTGKWTESTEDFWDRPVSGV